MRPDQRWPLTPTRAEAEASESTGGRTVPPPPTQLSVLGAAEGVDVPLAVHHHAELGTAGRLHQRLALVQDLHGHTGDSRS